MADPTARRLCIFARVPVLGQVKRRLAADLGAAGALAAYRELVAGTLRRCIDERAYASELWITGENGNEAEVRTWCDRYALRLRRQEGADLGARMWHALALGIAEGNRTVVIGTDCPDLDRAYLAKAFTALERSDVVIGPAEDGGYGLIGLARALPELFHAVPWGGPDVLSATLARAEVAGATVSLLPVVFDVDRLPDWVRYRQQVSEVG